MQLNLIACHFCALLLGITSSLSPKKASATDAKKPAQLAPIVAALGFTPLDTPATNFTLPDLSDRLVELKTMAGNWVVLVFWATWCGACAEEMPYLEYLHNVFKDRHLKVVAVSIDEGPVAQVRDYARNHELSYPILVDTPNRIAAQYHVQSVPSLYLVSPELQLVGFARGAINWSEAFNRELVNKLLDHHPPSSAVGKGSPHPAAPEVLPAMESAAIKTTEKENSWPALAIVLTGIILIGCCGYLIKRRT